jgi:hypothetical protein
LAAQLEILTSRQRRRRALVRQSKDMGTTPGFSSTGATIPPHFWKANAKQGFFDAPHPRKGKPIGKAARTALKHQPHKVPLFADFPNFLPGASLLPAGLFVP